MEKRVDYRRQISIMTIEEFVRFCSIMQIDLNKFHTRRNDRLKQEVGDLLSRAYHKLRNSPPDFKRFNSLVIEAIWKATMEKWGK